MILVELFSLSFSLAFSCWFTDAPANANTHTLTERIVRPFNFDSNSFRVSKKETKGGIVADAAVAIFDVFYFVQFAFITGPHMFHMRTNYRVKPFTIFPFSSLLVFSFSFPLLFAPVSCSSLFLLLFKLMTIHIKTTWAQKYCGMACFRGTDIICIYKMWIIEQNGIAPTLSLFLYFVILWCL